MNQEIINQGIATVSGILELIYRDGLRVIDSPYQVLIAIGTLGAVLAAVFSTLWPSFISWLNRPRLVFEFDNSEPFCRHTFGIVDISSGQKIALNSYYIRLRIKNIGNSIAKKCEVKLIAIADLDLRKLRTDFDPVVLHWVGSDSVVMGRSGENKSIQLSKNQTVDINSREYEYIDLISTCDKNDKFEIQAIDYGIPRGIVMDPKRDNYYFLITIYAENANPFSEIYRIVNSSNYDQISLSPASVEEKNKFYSLLK